nr:MAG TPA: hypothetical protein [Caudoviricetes sp.]
MKPNYCHREERIKYKRDCKYMLVSTWIMAPATI